MGFDLRRAATGRSMRVGKREGWDPAANGVVPIWDCKFIRFVKSEKKKDHKSEGGIRG